MTKLTSMTPAEWRYAGGNEAVLLETSDTLDAIQWWGNPATGQAYMFVVFNVERGDETFSYRVKREEQYEVAADDSATTVTFISPTIPGVANGRNGGHTK